MLEQIANLQATLRHAKSADLREELRAALEDCQRRLEQLTSQLVVDED